MSLITFAKKRMPEIDDELYFSIDERANTVDLSDKGRQLLSPNDPEFFVLPDLSMSDEYNDLTEDERFKKQQELEKTFQKRARNFRTSHSC